MKKNITEKDLLQFLTTILETEDEISLKNFIERIPQAFELTDFDKQESITRPNEKMYEQKCRNLICHVNLPKGIRYVNNIFKKERPFITNYKIKKLFGTYNVNIDFSHPIKIFVGENGIGKTTILDMLYYTISDNDTDFFKLKYYDFEEICITFAKHKPIRFTKKDIIMYEKTRLPMEIRRLYRFFSPKTVEELIQNVQHNQNLEKVYTLLNEIGVSFDLFKLYVNSMNTEGDIFSSRNKIKKLVDSKILHLPTYRRIEASLSSLNQSVQRELNSEHGINIGMTDIEKIINTAISKIRESYKTGFSKIFFEIMEDILNNKEMKSETIESTENISTILERLDNSLLDAKHKKSLKNRFESFFENNSTNLEYNYFINKLLVIYDGSKELENNLYKFEEKCNFYLVNKKFIFDRNTLSYTIQEQTKTKRDIKLDQLSSGEKQLVALFAKLYLDEDNDYIVLFDEPELSLSLEWQKTFLPDIYNTGKCKFLFAVTHSPFIFDNDFDQHAQSLEECIMEDY